MKFKEDEDWSSLRRGKMRRKLESTFPSENLLKFAFMPKFSKILIVDSTAYGKDDKEVRLSSQSGFYIRHCPTWEVHT